MGRHTHTDLDAARDELMSHVHRCGVLQATPEQQQEWLHDTMGYMADRYPALTPDELAELQAIGERFCQPVIPHGKGHTALTAGDDHSDADTMAGAV